MPSSKRVEWDEENLEFNAEYQRLHPVTMHIDEPKTPYCHMDDDEVKALEAEIEAENKASNTWDPKVNAMVKKIKERAINDTQGMHVAPVAPDGRPMLALETVTGEHQQERHAEEFRKMRKAVYADEGARFKAMLHQQQQEDDDEADEGV